MWCGVAGRPPVDTTHTHWSGLDLDLDLDMNLVAKVGGMGWMDTTDGAGRAGQDGTTGGVEDVGGSRGRVKEIPSSAGGGCVGAVVAR